jgi:hypothetical protein
MNMKTDKEILAERGWDLDCLSPLSITNNEGSYAVGLAAKIIIDCFKDEELFDKYEKIMDRPEWNLVEDLMRKSFIQGFNNGYFSNNHASPEEGSEYVKTLISKYNQNILKH